MKYIPIAQPVLKGNELKYLKECIETTWLSHGKFVEKFEKSFANYCKAKYGIANSNGTTALHLALIALGIKPGDEVIVPDLTFVSPVNMVIYLGAKPVFVDADRETWNIDTAKIEKVITKKTKAIIVVHLYGQPCNMKSILKLAKKYNLFIIEDCAEAHGAEYYGKRVGGFGDISCFSFFGNKIITTGEGGMCLTNRKDLAEKMRVLLNCSMDPKKKYWHDEIGFNYRLTNIQAAIGLAQLEKIDWLLDKKRKITKLYDDLLKDIPGIILAKQESNVKPVCWLYSVLIDPKICRVDRDQLIAGLKKNNIETRPFFWPLHKMPPYKKYVKKGQIFKAAECLSLNGINLPSASNLTQKQIAYIAGNIKKTVQ